MLFVHYHNLITLQAVNRLALDKLVPFRSVQESVSNLKRSFGLPSLCRCIIKARLQCLLAQLERARVESLIALIVVGEKPKPYEELIIMQFVTVGFFFFNFLFSLKDFECLTGWL